MKHGHWRRLPWPRTLRLESPEPSSTFTGRSNRGVRGLRVSGFRRSPVASLTQKDSQKDSIEIYIYLYYIFIISLYLFIHLSSRSLMAWGSFAWPSRLVLRILEAHTCLGRPGAEHLCQRSREPRATMKVNDRFRGAEPFSMTF